MAKARTGAKLAAGCLLFWGGLAPAWAAPTVAQILNFRPRQEGVAYSTPTAQEQESCKVELVNGAKAGSNGWMLRDPQGKPLRRFFDTNGDKHIDVYSYYQDGVEVYREIDSNYNEKIDQYRWLNGDGMKWGVDQNEDGKIDSWKIISADEVSQEILQAVITRDFDRLQALWISEAEMKALDLSASEISRIQTLQKSALVKFQGTVARLNLNDKSRWVHLECPPPQCIPAEQAGMKHDVIRQMKASILYDHDGKNELMKTGELVQVGLAWRLVDAPSPGGDVDDPTVKETPDSPKLRALLEDLRQHDQKAPKAPETTGPNPEVVSYNIRRAEIIARIVPEVVKAEDREQWVRQMADSYSAAAQSSPATDKAAYERLVELEKQVEKEQPGSNTAGYVTFREMSADYAAKLPDTKNFVKTQEQWMERLAKFVQTYPRADDAPDALLQLGMVSEFVNKEIEAKNWYSQLVKNFSEHALAVKARGALRRLDLEGKTLELAGQKVGGGSFDVSELQGKVVVVYYWASWNQQSTSDFGKLKALMSANAGKGVELVCVNLDNSPPEPGDTSRTGPGAGVQLFHPAGLESPLATNYGIMVLPNLFLVGKDGKVVSRTVQINNLEDEVKKLVK